MKRPKRKKKANRTSRDKKLVTSLRQENYKLRDVVERQLREFAARLKQLKVSEQEQENIVLLRSKVRRLEQAFFESGEEVKHLKKVVVAKDHRIKQLEIELDAKGEKDEE